MGRALVEKLLPALDQLKWPTSSEASELGRATYMVGLEKADEYSDDPKPLAAAIRTFVSGQSLPYAFAGAAYTLLKAAREADGSYTQIGLDTALEWLEKAQALAPDSVEINFIEALIYADSGRFEDARLILDYLGGLDPSSYWLATAEIAYWQRQRKLKETVSAYERAIELGDTVPRKLRLRHRLGDFYLGMGQHEKALEVYRELSHFSTHDAQLWHNMSLAYFNLEDYREAVRCNKKALALHQDFHPARLMEVTLRERLGTGALRRFLGN
jgi:tetratricopeptide (TPR) repeat protein